MRPQPSRWATLVAGLCVGIILILAFALIVVLLLRLLLLALGSG